MGPLTRRQALGALSAATALTWLANSAPPLHKARAGAPITLSCPGADAFLIDGDLPTARRFSAPGGTLRLRAPGLALPDGRPWARLRCTPLAGGVPCGPAATVEILTLSPLFGA